MTREDFKKLPLLVMEQHVVACGYGTATLRKFVDCAVLVQVMPPGSGHARYQKKQLAQLVGWEDCLAAGAFGLEKPLMDAKAVRRWTGWSEVTLEKIVQAGGLHRVKPAGSGKGKFRKAEVAVLVGLEKLV